MEEAEVLVYVEGIEHVLADAAGARERLASDLEAIDELVKAIPDVQQKIEDSLVAAESILSQLEVVVRSLEGATSAGGTDQNGLPPAFENIVDQAEQILGGEVNERVEGIRRLPGEFAARIDGIVEDGKQKFQAVHEQLEERIEALVAASAAVREKADELAETVNDTRDDLIEKASKASAGVVEILEAFSALSGEEGDALMELLAERLEEETRSTIDKLTDGTLSEVNDFAGRVHEFAGQIAGQLEGINDTFGEIDQITRPIQPVLELAGSIG